LRAFVKGEFKQDWHGEIEDCSRVIEMSGATIEQCAYAFINRAFAKENLRDSDGAIKDHTAVIDMSDAPAALRAQAFYGRGVVKGQLCGDSKGAIADYTNAIELPGAST